MNMKKVGWREWLSLPDIGLPAIKAKIDTGAKTSALHAFYVERFSKNRSDYLKFSMHPVQRCNQTVVLCEAPLFDQREVTDSGGHIEQRYVIQTRLVIDQEEWPIELTLTNRDTMRFRMLLGREAMKGRLLVDPSVSYNFGDLDADSFYPSPLESTKIFRN